MIKNDPSSVTKAKGSVTYPPSFFTRVFVGPSHISQTHFRAIFKKRVSATKKQAIKVSEPFQPVKKKPADLSTTDATRYGWVV